MSGKIRAQLGHVKKRVTDRIDEASSSIGDGDFQRSKDFCTIFNANIVSLDKLMTLLSKVVDTVVTDNEATGKALKECAELNMNAVETIATPSRIGT